MAEQFDEKTQKRADVCLNKCSTCKKGREKQSGFAFKLVKLEDKLNICPWCKAYRKVYGVHAWENPLQS
jgi:hypothetical protein